MENPQVTSPDRTMSVMQQPNFNENYTQTKINVDGEDYFILTHISRIVHEGTPPSVKVHSSDKFSMDDLKIAFKNEFPSIFVKTMGLLYEHKNKISIDG